ncbi:MAG: hypothetical protein U9P79_08255 [Candidatus Cloacimonadota bacterium]|nr:hypothetical protein [Candidatus Cloacimonadota bacterium]
MQILITAALNEELQPLEKFINTEFSKEKNVAFSFLKTGLGMKKTRREFSYTVKKNVYDFVLNIGTAGSLDSRFKIGDIFFATAFSKLFNNEIITIKNPFANFYYIPEDWKRGELFTSLKPVVNRKQTKMVKSLTQSQAVDMEAYAIADICLADSIPFFSLKIISDHAEPLSKKEFLNNLHKIQGFLHSAVNIFIKQNLFGQKKWENNEFI